MSARFRTYVEVKVTLTFNGLFPLNLLLTFNGLLPLLLVILSVILLASLHCWKSEHLIMALPSLSMRVAKKMATSRLQSTARGIVLITSSNVWI